MAATILLKRIARMSRAELEELPTPVLDRVAFGFESGDLLDVPMSEIVIIYPDDLAQAVLDVMESSLAKRILREKDPIAITVRRGRLELEDGHHRYVSAKMLKRKTLPARVTIDDNPINVILAKR